MTSRILSLHQSAVHEFSKELAPSLRLLAGLGVEGDAHCGETVQHRSRVAVDPQQIDPALLPGLAYRDDSGNLVRLAGVMAVVLKEGLVHSGDPVRIEWPEEPHRPLAPV